MKIKPKLQLHWQILIAIGLALFASTVVKFYGGAHSFFGAKVIVVCGIVGTLFLNGLKMLVVPLIVSSIVSGMIGIGAERNLGRMGLKTLGFYLSTTLIATVIGLICVNLIQPGNVEPEVMEAMKMQAQQPPVTLEAKINQNSTAELINIFLHMVPVNVFAAATDNSELLAVILFSLLFGYFVTRLPLKHRRFQVKLWKSFQEITIGMADLILLFAPIGVFALVTPQFITFGFGLFKPIAKFTLTVLFGLGFHMFGILSFIMMFARINPIEHLRAMAPAIMTAFSTSSSVTTLPITMECVEKTAGVSNRVSSFTLPLGATINMNGTALYECIVVVFIAQFFQIENPGFQFGLIDQFKIVILSLVTSIGVAGIPAASIVAIGLIMGVVGLPFEYVGIVLVVDRILDMCRTVVNIYGDSVAAVVIGKSEGETGIYNKTPVLNTMIE